MAIDKIRGTQLYIKIGDGASPEVFTHPCLINTKRGIQWSSNTSKIPMPDCDNPDDPAWMTLIKDGLSGAINGAGMLDTTDIGTYDAWYRSPETKNVQVWLGTRGYWQGAFHLTGWAVNGDRNAYADATLTIESDGEVAVWTPA